MVEESLTALSDRDVLKWRDTGALLHSWSDMLQRSSDRRGRSTRAIPLYYLCLSRGRDNGRLTRKHLGGRRIGPGDVQAAKLLLGNRGTEVLLHSAGRAPNSSHDSQGRFNEVVVEKPRRKIFQDPVNKNAKTQVGPGDEYESPSDQFRC